MHSLFARTKVVKKKNTSESSGERRTLTRLDGRPSLSKKKKKLGEGTSVINIYASHTPQKVIAKSPLAQLLLRH